MASRFPSRNQGELKVSKEKEVPKAFDIFDTFPTFDTSFMNKVIDTQEAITISGKLRSEDKTIVLAGGVFDILHVGHIALLEKAKEQGDILFVMLESDTSVTKKKGPQRPIHSQSDRARILSALSMVDYVIALPDSMNDQDYDSLVFGIKPAIIATTQGDKEIAHKERQAHRVGAAVIPVVTALPNTSTTRLANLLVKDL